MYAQRSISDREVHDLTHAVLLQSLKIKDFSKQCSASMLVSVLLFAATRMTSPSGACRRLVGAPSDETIRQALLENLPAQRELERRVGVGLASQFPKGLWKRAWRVVIDYCDLPYYGQPQDPKQMRRGGKPKDGTRRFHTYATAFIVHKGYRFTLAATLVQRDEQPVEVLKRLLQRVRRLGVRIRVLLLDREFFLVDVVRYLRRANRPFLVPVVHRGRKPKDPSKAKGTRQFLLWRRSGWSSYTWSNPKGRKTTVQICVSRRWYIYRQQRRWQTLVFAFWGFQRASPLAMRELYRKRFGIETSFRQVNQARIRTSSRDAVRRFLFVAIALLIRNVWALLHLVRLAVHGRIRLAVMPFVDMLHAIQTFVELILKCVRIFGAPKPVLYPNLE